ncbi:PREDICTED: bolA-like protein 3 [Ceratosolen solmsi marchali]|uniref:BolA-like protein 3 n=1 Tax=Ceratosolen solmsi marchali TaxID=326594 RepID=A0AAJ6YIE2_9HYME|nr:PREDICTED: bolA-like protein 3 [Ceratosolen solmsi marchali]
MFYRMKALNYRNFSLLSRVWNGPQNVLTGKQAEEKMINILKDKFPKAETIEVSDVSGGCGAMFEVNVIAPEFRGLNTVKQHRIINEALKEEIKDMHGIRIHTGIPDS